MHGSAVAWLLQGGRLLVQRRHRRRPRTARLALTSFMKLPAATSATLAAMPMSG